jgi:hypothetical protein
MFIKSILETLGEK